MLWGKVRGVAARTASADLSIFGTQVKLFRPAALAPPRSGEPSPRQPGKHPGPCADLFPVYLIWLAAQSPMFSNVRDYTGIEVIVPSRGK